MLAGPSVNPAAVLVLLYFCGHAMFVMMPMCAYIYIYTYVYMCTSNCGKGSVHVGAKLNNP